MDQTDERIADELEVQAAQFASRAAECYPESVFPPPQLGIPSTPDNYSAAGYRNAYRLAAADLRARAAELRKAQECSTCDYPAGEPEPVACPDCGQ